jgi:hypothetical protein
MALVWTSVAIFAALIHTDTALERRGKDTCLEADSFRYEHWAELDSGRFAPHEGAVAGLTIEQLRVLKDAVLDDFAPFSVEDTYGLHLDRCLTAVERLAPTYDPDQRIDLLLAARLAEPVMTKPLPLPVSKGSAWVFLYAASLAVSLLCMHYGSVINPSLVGNARRDGIETERAESREANAGLVDTLLFGPPLGFWLCAIALMLPRLYFGANFTPWGHPSWWLAILTCTRGSPIGSSAHPSDHEPNTPARWTDFRDIESATDPSLQRRRQLAGRTGASRSAVPRSGPASMRGERGRTQTPRRLLPRSRRRA